MSRFVDPFTTGWFLDGLRWGIGALVIGLIIALMWRRSGLRSAPVVGALIVIATLLAMPVAREVPAGLWQAVALLAAAGAMFPWARRIPLLPALLAIPGAWWVTAHGELPVQGWKVTLLFAMVVVGAPLAASFDRHHGLRGYGPVLASLTILGVFTTLPDTEEILVMVGAAIPLTLLAWPIPLARIGAVGLYPMLGVLAWVIAWGGRGRDTAIIGAVASLGILVVEPIVRWMRSTTLLAVAPSGPFGPLMVGFGQLLVVGFTARVAGLQSEVVAAAGIAAAALVVAALVLAVSPRSGRHRLQ